MGSMHTGLEEHFWSYDKMAAYFAERARGGVGLIVTGGIAPNFAGRVSPLSAELSRFYHVWKHRSVTKAVHAEGGKIALQILHAGRYAYHPFSVAPSAIKSPITPFRPSALTSRGVEKTINDFVNCARLAQEAGYDGVEVMGSEGYLINEFIVSKTNHRKDKWGGPYEQRIRFPIEIVKRIREKVGRNFIIIYRLSMLDLVNEGSTWQEIVKLGKEIENAGASLINTGIGWHEAKIPTIATMVPRAAFVSVTKQMKSELTIPLITSNRINTPEAAEDILSQGYADMISMARPFLADPEFVVKAFENRADEINTCIACNQACLDHVFKAQRATCLVNPRACYETELVIKPIPTSSARRRIAVVGAGPAGLAFATTASKRGHKVVLFEAQNEIGGQLNLAKILPGKREFYETLRYYQKMLELNKANVEVKLRHKVSAKEDLLDQGFTDVVIATGIIPRRPHIPGIGHPKVVSYVDVLQRKVHIGQSVAIIGAGGIGFDVADFLTEEVESGGGGAVGAALVTPNNRDERFISLSPQGFAKYWGIDLSVSARGGIDGVKRQITPSARTIYLLQRSVGKFGKSLGKTTGWVHRASLKDKSVRMIDGISYKKIDDQGLHIEYLQKGGGSESSDKSSGNSGQGSKHEHTKESILKVDHIVICAGQESDRTLFNELQNIHNHNLKLHIIGGADVAVELDAKRAIKQGTWLAAEL